MSPPASPVEVVRIGAERGALFGITHAPAAEDTGVLVVMLTPGMQSRVGPCRLYVTAARAFAAAGVRVLRVDLAGAGDSEADIRHCHFDCHRPDEVAAVLRYAAETFAPRVMVAQGLCAGARVGVKASRLEPVDGILAWSTPILTGNLNMPQSPEEIEDRISRTVAREQARRVMRFVRSRRFLDLKWWRTYFPGGKGMSGQVRHVARSVYRSIVPVDPQQHHSPFLDSAERYVADDGRILFVYGDLDKTAFREFRARFPELPEDVGARQGYAVIPGGTHTFSTHAAQQAVISVSLEWLRTQFRTRETGRGGRPRQASRPGRRASQFFGESPS